MKMMGIGKHRFEVLAKAARDPECQHCPYDPRYVPTGPKPSSEKRARVYDFLLELYDQVAESIPDGLNSNKRPRRGLLRTDPESMQRETIKHLPAGSINDYWRQCKASLRDESVSRKLFSEEP